MGVFFPLALTAGHVKSIKPEGPVEMKSIQSELLYVHFFGKLKRYLMESVSGPNSDAREDNKCSRKWMDGRKASVRPRQTH